VLLDFGSSEIDIEPWKDRVKRVEAAYEDQWHLPVVGVVTASKAVLIRPDGYVAWADDGTGQGLAEALSKWFGPADAHCP
jgi:hypothetical protein